MVIAIISILAGLLLPVLSKARSSAMSVLCTNNLRQIATWATQYANDNNGILPVSGGGGPGSASDYNDYWWPLSPNRWWQKHPELDTSRTSGTVLHCPAVSQAALPRWKSQSRSDHDYGMNKYVGGGTSWDWQYNSTLFSNPGKIHLIRPKPKLARFDSRVHWFTAPYFNYNSSLGWYVGSVSGALVTPWMFNEANSIYGRGHPNNSINVVFFDIHVKSMLRNDWNGMTRQEQKDFDGAWE